MYEQQSFFPFITERKDEILFLGQENGKPGIGYLRKLNDGWFLSSSVGEQFILPHVILKVKSISFP